MFNGNMEFYTIEIVLNYGKVIRFTEIRSFITLATGRNSQLNIFPSIYFSVVIDINLKRLKLTYI